MPFDREINKNAMGLKDKKKTSIYVYLPNWFVDLFYYKYFSNFSFVVKSILKHVEILDSFCFYNALLLFQS